MRILLVEDEKKMASFIERGLKEEGYAVDIAVDGQAIFTNLTVGLDASCDQFGNMYLGPFPWAIPSGLSITARCAINRWNISVSAAHRMGLIVYGFS